MPTIVSWLTKEDYKLFRQQCDLLDETPYEYIQKAIRERLRRQKLSEKANRILWGKTH